MTECFSAKQPPTLVLNVFCSGCFYALVFLISLMFCLFFLLCNAYYFIFLNLIIFVQGVRQEDVVLRPRGRLVLADERRRLPGQGLGEGQAQVGRRSSTGKPKSG